MKLHQVLFKWPLQFTVISSKWLFPQLQPKLKHIPLFLLSLQYWKSIPALPWQFLLKQNDRFRHDRVEKHTAPEKWKIKTYTSCNWNKFRSQLWWHKGVFQNSMKGVWKEFRWAVLVFNICQWYKICTVPWVLCKCVSLSWGESLQTEGTVVTNYFIHTY